MPKTQGTTAAGSGDKKKTAPKGKASASKIAAQEAEKAQRHHIILVLVTGVVCFALAVFSICPGSGVLLLGRTILWGLFGALWFGWFALLGTYWVQWARKQSLKEKIYQIVGRVLLLLSCGGLLFLLAHDSDQIANNKWSQLVASAFDIRLANEPRLDLWTTLTNGGFFATLFSAAIARNCGKPGSIVIYVFLILGCLLMGFPSLRAMLIDKINDYLLSPNTKSAKATAPSAGTPADDPFPEEAAEQEAPKKGLLARFSGLAKKRRPTNEDPGSEGAYLAQTQPLPPLDPYYGTQEDDGAQARRQLFRDFQNWQLEAADTQAAPSGGGMAFPSTVIEDLGSATPGPEEIARRIASENPARAKAQQAGEDTAARAAIDALMQDAAASAPAVPDYIAPPLNCLSQPRSAGAKPDRGEEDMIERKLLRTLESFGVTVEMVGRSRGPAVTRYELLPAEGVKISKITSLSDDIALRLAAQKVRIEAPIPGKAAVGVEVPNRVRAVVSLRELVESEPYRTGTQKSRLTVALGKDIVGSFICADLAKLPHLLIAGTTGSGKSVCMNTLILSLLYNASPAQVKLIMVDPKQVEFTVYSGIPHLLVPVVSDPLKAAGALGWAVNEMERRYTLISEQNVRDLDSYNGIAERRADLETMPKVVIFIDELSDLMMVAPSDVEDSIQRLTQKGRAAGIHLVVATQRPSVDVITGVIKSNLPGRIALSVASQIDSRTIINSAGAEQLLGNGDMLFSLNGGNNAVRVQGCYVSDNEVQRVTRFVRDQGQGVAGYDDSVWEEIERNAAMAGSGKKKGGMLAPSDDDGESDDPMLAAAVEVVVDAQMASTTMLQKKLKLGYARASRLVDLLEEKGVVGPPEGSKPRKVLIGKAQWLEIQASGTPAAGLSAVAQTPAKEPTAVPTAMPWGE